MSLLFSGKTQSFQHHRNLPCSTLTYPYPAAVRGTQPMHLAGSIANSIICCTKLSRGHWAANGFVSPETATGTHGCKLLLTHSHGLILNSSWKDTERIPELCKPRGGKDGTSPAVTDKGHREEQSPPPSAFIVFWKRISMPL